MNWQIPLHVPNAPTGLNWHRHQISERRDFISIVHSKSFLAVPEAPRNQDWSSSDFIRQILKALKVSFISFHSTIK
jgi:hypothetical protein